MPPQLAITLQKSLHLEKLIQAGADTFYIEHSQYSPRSFICNQDEEENIKNLVNNIHKFKKIAWLNLEKRFHPDDITALIDTLPHFKEWQLRHFRIQDLGLIKVFEEHYPEATLCYVAEFGNSNHLSVKSLEHKLAQQQLSNDCPLPSLKRIRQQCPNSHLSIQVHGPILLQYSKRRYIQSIENSRDFGLIRYIEDEELPNRAFKVYDSPLGHCMFAHFDRCLIKELPKLLDCQLDTWFIDSRGEEISYALAALRAFKKAISDIQQKQDPQQWRCPPDDFNALQAASPRALTPAFFKANLSDRERPNSRPIPDNAQKIGSIIDVIKGQQCSLLLDPHAPMLKKNSSLLIATPSGKIIPLTITKLLNAQQSPITSSQNYDFVSVNWQKGIEVKSWVFIKNNE